MRTLDEVIELSEKILTFAYLPKDDTTTTAGLALYYLRELRHILNNTVWVESTKEEKGYWKLPTLPETANDPLTWDELRQMEGKPIWVEDYDDDDCYKRWYILERFEKTECDEYAVLNSLYFSRNYYNDRSDGWQAYRKETE